MKRKLKSEVISEEKRLSDLLFDKKVITISHEKTEKKLQSINNNISTQNKSIWEDEDDKNVFVELNSTNRLKKLKNNVTNSSNSKVTGMQLSKLLKDRFVYFAHK